MFKIIAIVIVVLIATVAVLAMQKPDAFRVERSAMIKAPPEKIFALINDFRRWDAWSPYEKKDPAMKRTYSGATSGQGAVYEFQGNRQVGTGRLEITQSTPSSRIVIKMDFLKPIEGHNTVEFTLEPQGEATNVTWTLYGPSNFMAKVMQVFFSMDRMVGGDFESGLASMQAAAEK